jgi:hypothetical protein
LELPDAERGDPEMGREGLERGRSGDIYPGSFSEQQGEDISED